MLGFPWRSYTLLTQKVRLHSYSYATYLFGTLEPYDRDTKVLVQDLRKVLCKVLLYLLQHGIHP